MYGSGAGEGEGRATKNPRRGAGGGLSVHLEVLELRRIFRVDLGADRIRHAMEHVSAEHLIACTDCGMVPRSRRSAEGKMNALAAGAALVNRELGS